MINSVLRPEEIFAHLGKRIANQILRRIFEPYLGCEVYEIKKNQAQLDRILREKLVFSAREFQDWYQPFVRQVSEPDYLFIEKE